MSNRIGFMQGRLSPMVNGMIQAFPWDHWREEFPIASDIAIPMMEWTLDQDRLYENPLMTQAGQEEIRSLCSQYDFSIPSLTGDCFMQAPFWKVDGDEYKALTEDFIAICKSCVAVGISIIVIPLVDNGGVDNKEQEDKLVSFLESQAGFLRDNGLKVVFESDFAPAELARLMDRFDPSLFGVNYDIGNSAALGYDPVEEVKAYGERIINVHIKDRPRNGTTVPLGDGDADFEKVYTALAQVGYNGNYILQTARAADERHAEVLAGFRDFSQGWLDKSGA